MAGTGVIARHCRLATAVLVHSVPSHEVGTREPELSGEPRVRVLGSLGRRRREPHAQLVHHTRVEAVVLGSERHSKRSTLKEATRIRFARKLTVTIDASRLLLSENINAPYRREAYYIETVVRYPRA